jgi:conjugative relaxase-like TrwC/TraI family protein
MVGSASITASGGKYSRYLTLGQYEEAYWAGRAARELGLEGRAVTVADFTALGMRRHPDTREQIKPKHKQKITLFDVTVGAPKSVSLVALYDDRVRLEHQKAARVIGEQIEAQVPFGNTIYSQVHHYTSRAGDPHLHTHVPILNLSFNPERGAWECLRQNFMHYNASRDLTYEYRERYSQGLVDLGYQLEDREKHGFEIDGVPGVLMEKFSQRAQQIDRIMEDDSKRYGYRKLALIDRPSKGVEFPISYRDYLESQKEKLTPDERVSLRETVERAEELRVSHRLKLRLDIGEGADSGPQQKPWSYGVRVGM